MPTEPAGVLRLGEVDADEVRRLLAHFGIELLPCSDAHPIPGSYWGDDEAGLRGNCVYARNTTPLHSVLHEACHYICADPARRERLDTDAGSDDAEESAVCYLQILLADRLGCLGRARLFGDMDTWGYSFRLGSTRAWFEQDATDALAWLIDHGIIESRR